MRKWIVVALALALALAVVPLALAHPGGGGAKGKNKFNLVGTVVSVALPDATATPTPGMLTVKVKAGTKTVKSVLDSTRLLGLVVDPAARVRIVTAEGCKTATLAKVRALSGAKVKVRGTIEASVFTAKWIKAKMMPTPEPSSPLPSPAP